MYVILLESNHLCCWEMVQKISDLYPHYSTVNMAPELTFTIFCVKSSDTRHAKMAIFLKIFGLHDLNFPFVHLNSCGITCENLVKISDKVWIDMNWHWLTHKWCNYVFCFCRSFDSGLNELGELPSNKMAEGRENRIRLIMKQREDEYTNLKSYRYSSFLPQMPCYQTHLTLL